MKSPTNQGLPTLKGHFSYDEKTKVITSIVEDYKVHPEGLGHLLFHCMKKHAGKIAQISVETGATETYDELFINSVRTAIELKKLGVKPGDVVTIYAENEPDYLPAFIAISLVGAINAALDPVIPLLDCEGLLKQVYPKVMIVSQSCEENTVKMLKKLGMDSKIIVFGETKANIKFADITQPREGEDDFEPYVVKDLEEISFIKFSSGTTGLPKGIVWNHKFPIYHTKFEFPGRLLLSSNLYWVGATNAAITAIRSGGIRLSCIKIDPVALWDQIEEYKADFISLSAYMSIKFMEARPEGKVSHLKFFLIGGSGTSTEYILKIRESMPNTLTLMPFAQTETGPLLHSVDEKALSKPQSVGIPDKNLTYKIVDPDTEENVGFNQRGELRVKSDWFCSGYYKRDSSELYDAEGFLRTGDIFYFDEDFCFFCVDRIKEMFKYHNYHVQPAKCEAVLANHPEVDSCVIIGVPHVMDNNHICAVVVRKPGSKVTAKELEEYYNANIDEGSWIRAGVKFVDSMPVTPSGKISRGKLKRTILDEINKA